MLHMHPGGRALTRKVIAYCAFPANSTVVDIGCGAGETVEYLRDQCAMQAIGVDSEKKRLREGKKRNADLLLLQAKSENLPFDDGSIDGALMECSLSVMHDRLKTMRELARILAPGGKLGITDLYIRPKAEGMALRCYLPPINRSLRCITDNDLLALLDEEGFQLLCFEDQSACLKDFVAGYIMQYGLTPALHDIVCRAASGDFGKNEKETKLGYFLLIAEKKTGKENGYGKAIMPPV